MRAFVVCVVLAVAAVSASCTNMRDCCECLYEAGELECQTGDTKEECIDRCHRLCEASTACYCIASHRADCAGECNCNLP